MDAHRQIRLKIDVFAVELEVLVRQAAVEAVGAALAGYWPAARLIAIAKGDPEPRKRSRGPSVAPRIAPTAVAQNGRKGPPKVWSPHTEQTAPDSVQRRSPRD